MERLRLLEKNGQLPDYAEMPKDWLLAQKTTWWGKPLDPKIFWKGRVLWLDASAVDSAHRHGRMFPPMPYKDASLPHYKGDADAHPNEGTIEGPNIDYHWTSEERAFWNKFVQTHPYPPAELDKEQLTIAKRFVGKRVLEQDTGSRPAAPTLLATRAQIEIKRAIDSGFPQEAFTPDALNAAYILNMQQTYQTLIDHGNSLQSIVVKNFVARLSVPPSMITGSATDEQVQAANAWKIAYLNRLQEQNSDPSYINAYLKAWNLPASVLSRGAKR